jgi:hypothetical protein
VNAFPSGTVHRDQMRHAHPKPAAPLVYPSILTNRVGDDFPPLRATHQSLDRFTMPRLLKKVRPTTCRSMGLLIVGRKITLAPRSELSKQQPYSW